MIVQSDQRSSLSAFNSLAEEFFQKMIKTFPRETKLKIYYAHFKTTKQFDVRKPMEYVMSPMINNGYQILSKDEKFFKDDGYVDLAESFSSKTGLLNQWESIPEEIKNKIWEYVQSMYVLGMKALGFEEQLKSVLLKIQNDGK